MTVNHRDLTFGVAGGAATLLVDRLLDGDLMAAVASVIAGAIMVAVVWLLFRVRSA
jgi:hypothetical protein